MTEQTIRAVVVDPSSPDHFVIGDVPAPTPQPGEAVVRVSAVSLNRGEVRNAMKAPAGKRPGWDFAGVVEQTAADGSGPKPGTRVVGIMGGGGAWATRLACPTTAMAELPTEVSDVQAATLPVAGLTALHVLYKGGFLLGRRVLVTGATGGTGDFLCQLASLAGAHVIAIVRSADKESFVRKNGAEQVVIGEDPSGAAAHGPYWLIADSVAGPHFDKVLAMLAAGGTHVLFGTTAGAEPTINASQFYGTGRTKLYGFILFKELGEEPASVGLKTLADLVAAKKLTPHIDVEESWKNVGKVTKRLMDRKFVGKAVLRID